MKKNTAEKTRKKTSDANQQGPVAKLILTQEGQLIDEYPIKGEFFTIGRGKGNDIHLPEMGVSRVHAKILDNLEGNLVEDLNSTNGAFVNAKRISKYTLRDKDVIKIGKYKLSYKTSPDSSHSESKSANIKTSQLKLDDVITKKKRIPVDITALDFETTTIDTSQTNAQQPVIEMAGKIMDSSPEKTSRKRDLDQVLKTLEDLLD